jgi:hypothetical protein
MSKPTLREILEFLWDTKIWWFYMKLGSVTVVFAILFVLVYWLVTGEIPE